MSTVVRLSGSGLEAEPEPPRRVHPAVAALFIAVIVVVTALGLARAVDTWVGVSGDASTPAPRDHGSQAPFRVTSEGWTPPQGPTLHRRCAGGPGVSTARSGPCRGR